MTKFVDDCISALTNLKTNEEYQKFSKEFYYRKNVIIIGNGGSNAVASHISQDYVKKAGKHSLAFSDPSMLTCFMNDYGVEMAYVKFLEAYASKMTLIILISSSGNSENILNCVNFCEKKGYTYGVLTAFDENNKVRTAAVKAKFNYWIDTKSYGVAECIHQIFLHAVIE